MLIIWPVVKHFSAASKFHVICYIKSGWQDCQMSRHSVMKNKRVHVFELRGYFHLYTEAQVAVYIGGCQSPLEKTIPTKGIVCANL